MKINILDAGIKMRAGHHYDYGLKLLKHFVEAGHDVQVYAFAGAEQQLALEFEGFGAFHRLFATYQYAPLSDYDRFAGEMVRFQRDSITLAEELRQVREADVWIWPTVLPQQINACAQIGIESPIVGCVYWDPGVQTRSLDAQLWRTALLEAHRRDVRFTLASVEGELRHRFMPIIPSNRFAVLPHPVDARPISKPRQTLERVGFFGHQREDKGATLMEPLLRQLVADGYAVTVQNSNADWQLPDVPGVERLHYVDDIAVPIAACDLVVLPYYVEQYRARGSGVLAECLGVGVPVAAPAGTLPGRIIEQAGVGPLFSAAWPAPIYQGIKFAEQNYAVFAANAFRCAKRFAQQNSIAGFASALLAAR